MGYAALLDGDPCRLSSVPEHPPTRDFDTTLLVHFDDSDDWNADYARVDPTEVGVELPVSTPGKFGLGAVVDSELQPDRLMYPGLDNINFTTGTLEFWARSRPQEPVWSDGREHWFAVLFPERSVPGQRYGLTPHAIALRKTADNQLELRLTDFRFAMYRAYGSLTKEEASILRLPVAELNAGDWHHILVSWDLRGKGRVWLLIDGEGVTASLNRRSDALLPNPGIYLFFGGFWQISADCDLDELHLQETSAASRLASSAVPNQSSIDEQRLLHEEDLARAVLDKLLELQFKGGLAAGYTWPNLLPGGWEFVGRGVDLWYPHSANAGNDLLRGWLIWGDDRYLDGAIEAADLFSHLQWENGSWAYHYTYSRGEFLPWGSAYIAQSMQSNQIRFLCLIYRLLGYERYREAVRRAGDWLVNIQHPEGAWNWHSYPEGKNEPFGNYALNDAVTPQAMEDLFVIWCATGDERYLKPILKGAEWILRAQAGPPTYGWADQYDKEFNMIWNRSTEPPAISEQAIRAAYRGLLLAYDLSADRRYMQALERVLGWLASVPESHRGYLWYDPESGQPLEAIDFEMHPISEPKGGRKRWYDVAIRTALEDRESGPVYWDWRGIRPQTDFDDKPAIEEFGQYFNADNHARARDALQSWVDGEPGPELLRTWGGRFGRPAYSLYGRTFEIGNAISFCSELLDDIESARVALGAIDADAVPLHYRSGSRTWVYMDPQRNFWASPKQKR